MTPNTKNTPTSFITTCLPFLNYIALFIIYIIGFVFSFKAYTETLGLSLLFIVHTFASIFVIKDVFSIIFGKDPKFVPILTQLTIPIAMIFHFISLILIIVMMYSIQSTYSIKHGSSIELPDYYIEKFSLFKNIFITNFVLCICLLFSLNVTWFLDQINARKFIDVLLDTSDIFFAFIELLFSPIMKKSCNKTSAPKEKSTLFQIIFSISIFVIDCIVLMLASYEIYLANSLSKINQLNDALNAQKRPDFNIYDGKSYDPANLAKQIADMNLTPKMPSITLPSPKNIIPSLPPFSFC